MFNGKYISIKSILYDILKYPFVEGINEEDVAMHLSNFLRIVGAPIIFTNNIKTLEIKNYRANIPNDMIYIRGIRFKDSNSDNYIAMKYNSNIYQSALHCKDTLKEQDCLSDITYSLNDSYIITSEENGEIQISYQSINVDEDGFPMIPDDVKVLMALKYFILWQYAEPEYFRNNVPKDKYQEIKQQYYWYIGAAQNSLNMPSPDQMKTLENGIIRLIKSTSQHENFWNEFTRKEVMNRKDNIKRPF